MEKCNKIDIFALTDSHQEARKLCTLFSGIIARATKGGKNTLICDGGDLFKGIYERELCVASYITLRRLLPEAKIVFALGNNDFGFNSENMEFLKHTSDRFNKANIHVICANLKDTETGRCPKWVDPYILLDIGGKKIMVTSFCINYIKLHKYNLHLEDIADTFTGMIDTIKHISPDALIVINHALRNSSAAIWNIAQEHNLRLDLIIGGHEHSEIAPDPEHNTYYPLAFSRNMLRFDMKFANNVASAVCTEIISSKIEPLNPIFESPLTAFENAAGLNIPVAPSTLDLPRSYSEFSPLGSFTTDQMRIAAGADIALLSTGYLVHALRYEPNKMLTMYNIERVFSAQTPVQTMLLSPKTLKAVFNNAVRFRYTQLYGNSRFLQCSHNISLICRKNTDNFGEIKQILINGEPILDENAEPLHPEDEYLCALDPFIGSGEIGYDMLRALPKETLLKNNQLVRIKDLILYAVKEAANKYPKGSTYPCARLIDL